jgi:hypothetical protein
MVARGGPDNIREVNMANRNSTRSMQRYAIGALILIIIGWIVYVAARGPSTPGPHPVGDSGAAPVIRQ